jgi:hypothetical protein
MGYLNEDGLARYDGLIKNWTTFKSGTVDGVDPLLNWQKTDTAASVTFYPLPAAPLDPVVNFLFTETGPASGTKAPDNPSMITGVTQSKVTRCGKNLADSENLFVQPGRGIAASRSSDGAVNITGTTSGSGFVYFNAATSDIAKMPDYIESEKTYAFSLKTSYANCVLQVFFSNSLSAWGSPKLELSPNTSGTLTLDPSWIRGFVRIYIPSGYATNFDAYVQVEEGSAATSFEPYDGADYTVNLGGTYYGGSLDLSAGTMTVTHGRYVFTGNEQGWSNDGSGGLHSYNATTALGFTQLNLNNYITGTAQDGNSSCTHLPYTATSEANVQSGARTFACYCLVGGGKQLRFIVPFSTISDLQSWLSAQNAAGTPVAVTYKLVTPFTVQLTPTQIYSLSQLDPYTPRINTVYSDQTSVQVGYPKSPLATSTELTNAIVSLGGNV